MKVAVTGSHGLIGSALATALEADGHQVTRLVRGRPSGAGEVGWDPDAGTIDGPGLEGHDAVVHLAGVGIGDHRWTPDHKARVLDSRVRGTTLLAETLAGLDRPPPVLASGSAVGFYGDRGDTEVTEKSEAGTGFLATVVQAWESAAAPAVEAGIRVAYLRSGVVLSARGGALGKQLPAFKAGVGGRLGSGRQWLSWIAIGDEVGAIRHVIARPEIAGPVNLCAPEPVTNAEFTKTLGQVLHRPTVLPTPTTALRILFGREMVEEMLLAGQKVLPEVLVSTGYVFAFPALGAALAAQLGRSSTRTQATP
ncbi:MAG: TIGR01777 family protein [Acidimicrobiia bacterium]|nr:TIGR01777 family protein [Acidimicrobiia bacterium]